MQINADVLKMGEKYTKNKLYVIKIVMLYKEGYIEKELGYKIKIVKENNNDTRRKNSFIYFFKFFF